MHFEVDDASQCEGDGIDGNGSEIESKSEDAGENDVDVRSEGGREDAESNQEGHVLIRFFCIILSDIWVTK